MRVNKDVPPNLERNIILGDIDPAMKTGPENTGSKGRLEA